MRDRLENLFHMGNNDGQQTVKMRHKLLLYWTSMLLAVFGALIAVLSIAGVFSREGLNLEQELNEYQQQVLTELDEQINMLTAQGVAISEQASDILERTVYAEPVTILNDDAEKLKLLERELYPVLNTALRTSPCNGVWLVADATINTKIKTADSSRAGLYLRFANLNSKNAVHQDVTLYRGIPDIARENQLELHNRWKMEFDISLVKGYEEVMSAPAGKLSEKSVWAEKTALTDTWENMLVLMLPVYGRNDQKVGICGIELSDLYMNLSYPARESEYGHIVTVIAPVVDDQVHMTGGLTGGLGSTHLDEKEPLSIEDGRMFNTYLGADENYLGIHTKLDMKLVSGREMYLLTILPEEGYQAAALRERLLWIVGSGLFLLCMLSVAVILSGRFVNPISRSLEAIQENALLEENFSGISEIDTLLSFLMSNEKKTEDDTLPPDIADLFDEFAKKTTELTATEKNILGYYAEGKEVAEVAELAFISIHTVRKHNLNIYRKLGVSSREELILYIDLFRRCGRLGEIL